jgi:hypothetical protein
MKKLNVASMAAFFCAFKANIKYYGDAHVIHHIKLHLLRKVKSYDQPVTN